MRLNGSEPSRRNASQLRKQMTPPEIGLWLALRANSAGLRFRRQYSAGPYILDFYCAPARLAIEVDGEAHARGDRPARDAERDAWLAEQGVRTMRYAAQEVLEHLDGVVTQIMSIATKRRDQLNPPPQGGGGSAKR
ncbi:very-short-patch-repair endonuclease [Sphingomonas sp. BE123]|jgi:very-short-patch-repair endonuclease|uniref:endonuclease domain-containing protein n=1 Tax=Sphingomonas sp. BE123 TaxID=2817842 RepID=UPI00286510EA|nr:endonuclease domain-containing protein [Sphingomonas sp. BE123]MDR6852005.1 very-short-patch-repair endonuclease [Sphingomonas sp. BE123]